MLVVVASLILCIVISTTDYSRYKAAQASKETIGTPGESINLFFQNCLVRMANSTENMSSSLPSSAEGNVAKRNRIDQWLIFYSKFVSTASNQDKVLKLLQWTLFVASVCVSKLQKSNNEHENNGVKRRNIASGLSKLYGEISMARYVIRLLGFPTALEAWRTDSWTLDQSRPTYRWIGKILAGSMMLYYPTELLEIGRAHV